MKGGEIKLPFQKRVGICTRTRTHACVWMCVDELVHECVQLRLRKKEREEEREKVSEGEREKATF